MDQAIMAIVAGIDEAGYGPRLGPLLVSAVAFRTPPELAEADLWEALEGGVAPRRSRADGRLVIADSKALYQSRRGLHLLEEGALAALSLAGHGPSSLRTLLAALGADRVEEYTPYPWYRGLAVPLPAATKADRVASRARRFERALGQRQAALAAVFTVPLMEQRFNRLLAKTGNKAAVAFTAVAFLIRRLREAFPGEVIHLTVDKQGGRTHYLGPLLAAFPEADIEVRHEAQALSKYVLREPAGKMELFFREKADADCLPAALASMVSKYVRELFMRLLNAYWQGAVEGLKPTSGYPADAGQFLTRLEEAGALVGLDRDLLIRRR